MSSDGMFIPKRMHRSPAFRKLTASSTLVLFEFLYRRQMVKVGRRDRWLVKNNGEIVLTYAEITKKFGIARSTYRSALDQLVDLGFIDIAHHGGGMMKDSSKYGISERWRDYGKEEFIEKSRKKDNRKLGYTKNNWEKQTGRKRKCESKVGISNDTNSSITNDTREHKTSVIPSINHATHQISPNYYIQKGLEVLKGMNPSRYH
jgi:DNA-binding transcriptional regulator YhcF (GntR family)